MSFGSEITSFLTRVRNDLSGLLTSGGHAILAGFNALLTSIEQNGGPILITAAENAVLAAETAGGTGSEKLAAAQAAVVAELTTAGIKVAMNAVNGAIEAAVASLQSGALTPPVADAQK